MSGRAWTTGEIKRLEEMNAQGLSNQQIASKLNRTKQAIANQKYLQALVMPKKYIGEIIYAGANGKMICWVDCQN